MSDNDQIRIPFRQLLSFFIPLGFSASLTALSHVIINSTLARAPNPELVIASYALPMSIMYITERPALLLRQTCSVLVRDHQSFKSMVLVTLYVLGSIFLLDLLIGYSPLGTFVFTHLFGASAEMTDSMKQVYRVAMLVTIFSGIRCVFHGIIISNLRTKWLTFGMIFRLAGMYLLSLYFIKTEGVTSGVVGAIIFLTGMIIESIVSFIEGRILLKNVIPKKVPNHPVERPKHIFKFYRPLLYSAFIAVIIEPSINVYLGKTSGIQLSVAAFAVAASLTELVHSFFSYIHQIVLNFYQKDKDAVKRFVAVLSLFPSICMAILAYSPVGPWFMQHIMGLNDRLMPEVLSTLRVFMIITLVYPWLDFCNGMLMLRNQTKVFVYSQATNVCTVLLTLIISVAFFPDWNGKIGALAQSLGAAAEVSVLLFVLAKASKWDNRLTRLPKTTRKETI
ncbi:multi antimicrobial extrusion protein MatE [Paenibacillus radicis (ex Xue et al. 2023)]|uniref:Multi antimicrobial extrusion protein MatE n=1 Tax=Paenibacillus radicis (ex Xue et al. 2023) TaxID=2972489 RepID=A0ABT1YUV9_9BACL|nr:multi antimicrobial extrusion protein MatE [Paenibacillus radicis (ex Xue et al. 2023)]MCR8636585.1 multi antimicrobial extrusion protein MatE [Paenibacillus radicis (ex Xue et al. 2023)]